MIFCHFKFIGKCWPFVMLSAMFKYIWSEHAEVLNNTWYIAKNIQLSPFSKNNYFGRFDFITLYFNYACSSLINAWNEIRRKDLNCWRHSIIYLSNIIIFPSKDFHCCIILKSSLLPWLHNVIFANTFCTWLQQKQACAC